MFLTIGGERCQFLVHGFPPRRPVWNLCKLFYKRECQEKYSPAELEAGENRLAFSPLYRSMGVCRLSCYPSQRLQFAWAGGSRFSLPPFSSCQDGSSERPGAVKGRADRRGVAYPLTVRTVLRA